MKRHYYTKEIINICDNNHLTVEEIYKKLKEIFPNAWKSSVYRNVEQLAKKWELKKIIWIWKKAYFEKNIWNHIHLIDEKTGKIVDIDKNINLSWLPSDFNISNIDIKVFGEFI